MSSRGMPVTKVMREERRKKADFAHAEWRKQSTAQQLEAVEDGLKSGRITGAAKRQVARLQKLLQGGG